MMKWEGDTAAEDPLPLDDKCVHGTLRNGMTYYIQNNKKPEARAELRLVVKIGSVYEEDDEQGYFCTSSWRLSHLAAYLHHCVHAIVVA